MIIVSTAMYAGHIHSNISTQYATHTDTYDQLLPFVIHVYNLITITQGK